ncbi:MAG: ribosome silencing factor [Gammaproteobacteria bacterium]
MNSDELTQRVVSDLEELKAMDIKVMDVRLATEITDFMILASGGSHRQVMAIAENVVRRAKERGQRPMGVEGEQYREWILVDLCDVVVHVMLPEVRALYRLEKLWGEADSAFEPWTERRVAF